MKPKLQYSPDAKKDKLKQNFIGHNVWKKANISGSEKSFMEERKDSGRESVLWKREKYSGSE